MIFRSTNVCVILLILLLTNSLCAKNLGVWGPVFPIKEQDFLSFIYNRLNEMQKSGELKNAKNKFIKTVKEHALRPNPVKWLTTTTNKKTFLYDPTFVLTKNIYDENKNILIKAGTRINPFDAITLHQVLFFLDSDDKRQIRTVLSESKKVAKNYLVKFILVNGNIKDATKLLNSHIYFDQYGLLSKKFNLQHIPCEIKQRGKVLEIKEFAVWDSKNV